MAPNANVAPFVSHTHIPAAVHIVQQGFLTGQLTSLTPPTGTNKLADGSDRFIVKRYGASVPAVFETKIKAVLDALPPSIMLLPVPTYFVLIADGAGIGAVGSSTVNDAVAEIEELAFGVAAGCPNVDFEYGWSRNENIVMAEGEAEYFAMNVYANADVNTALADASIYPVAYNGKKDWTSKVGDNDAMLAGTPSGSPPQPGKATFHVESGSPLVTERLENLSPPWRTNPVGEVAYNYLKGTWRATTTHAELLQIWKDAYTLGYGAAFEKTMGDKWSNFVCAMEDALVVNGGTACVPNAAYDMPWVDPATRSAAATTALSAVLVGVAAVSAAVLL